MQGITRGNVLALCKTHGIPCKELDFSLTQVCVW
jgi:branched-subunit amino acid aminotransferase/4-amino-4-deoxychorismate lyase